MVADARRYARAIVLGTGFALCASLTARAAEPVDYARQVKPILAARCYRCHGPVKQESGLRLDTAAFAAKGGESGAAIVAGKSLESRLVHAIRGSNDAERMPKDGKPLTDAEIALITAWIDQGAAAPADEAPVDPRAHWSFRVPVRPPLPSVQRPEWLRNPIDAFVAAEHDRRGLIPQGDAPKHILLRRVYLDVIGLPPTVDESHAFAADQSPDALERVIDRLLTSPAYGERWGRHWMDVWRYSDWAGWTDGGQIRDSQPHIWRWRDWIIESLNRDKPYDQMVHEMLAADELAPTDESALRATGFLVRNYKMLSRETWMQDTVEHTTKALLGLTISCARCHDHMYDPITQQDYYRLRAIFEPHQVRIDRVPGQPDTKLDGLARAYDAELTAATYLFTRGDDRFPEKDRQIPPQIPAVFGSERFRAQTVALAPTAHYPDLRDHVHATLLKQASDEVAAARSAVAAKQKQLADVQALVKAATASGTVSAPDQKALAAGGKLNVEDCQAAVVLAERVLAAAEARSLALGARLAADKARFAQPPAAVAGELAKLAALAHGKAELATAEESLLREQQAIAALQRGDDNAKKQIPQAEQKIAAAQKRVDTARQAVLAPGETYPAIGTAYPATSTGRRTALARWITDPDNPFTARVAINHIWLRHFGRALVPTVFDFGKNGSPPTHPALLDYLAIDWSAPGDGAAGSPWAMKRLHRQIVTSSTYRMASTPAPSMAALDPDNVYLWRFEPRRLEAEVVRDGVLYVSDSLELAQGGSDVDHRQGLSSRRRSLYFRHAPEKQMEFLKLFDAAAPTQCYQRQTSVMPQQALALANSRLTLVAARQLARDLTKAVPSDVAAFAAGAIERVLARPATPDELGLCTEFLAQQTNFFQGERARLQTVAATPGDLEKPSGDPAMRARENLIHVLLNHHDFVTLR